MSSKATRKFTPELERTILDSLRDNPSLPSAAAKAGIHVATLRRWLELGMADEEHPLHDFAIAAQECRNSLKDEIVAALKLTALDPLHPQQTRAAQVLLKLYPSEFSDVRHHVQHTSELTPDHDLSRLSTDELRQLRDIVLRLKSDTDGSSADTDVEEVKAADTDAQPDTGSSAPARKPPSARAPVVEAELIEDDA